VQISQIAGGISGKGREVGKSIRFLVKVIVQGEGHSETFSKKVERSMGIRDKKLQS